jgi:hypothetical protein
MSAPLDPCEELYVNKGHIEGPQYDDSAFDAVECREEFDWRDDDDVRNANEDPERSYRRGFQQGAHAVMMPLIAAGLLDASIVKKLKKFIYLKIGYWRFDSPRRLKRHMRLDRAPKLELRRSKGDAR